MIEQSLKQARLLWPGVAVSFTIALAARFLSDQHGGPTLLYALLLGMAFHFLSQETSAAAGIDFSARTILRIGVALVGVRISVSQIAELGLMPVLLVLVCVAATLAMGWLLSRPLGLSTSQGILTGGSVGVCGVSAALAIASVLPPRKDLERDTLFTAIAVTLMGTIAMVLYPVLARALGFDTTQTGILLGATIHDVSQVVGAGYLVSDQAGTIATYVKLLRVSTLVPIVLVLAAVYSSSARRSASIRPPLLPLFLVMFAVLAVANSLQLVPQIVADPLVAASRWLLIAAIAALGMKTSIADLTKIGRNAIVLMVSETLFLLVLVAAAIMLLR